MSRNIFANVKNTELVSSPFKKAARAYHFDLDSELNVIDPDYGAIKEIGFVFNFRAELSDSSESQTVISVGSHGLSLLWENSMLSALVKQGDMEQRLTSEPIGANEWHEVALHVVDGELVLQIDENIYRTQLTVDIPRSSANIVLGGFIGEVSQFRVFDWESSLSLSFSGSRSATINLDEAGLGVLKISASSSPAIALSDSTAKSVTESRIRSLKSVDVQDECFTPPVPVEDSDFNIRQAISEGESFARYLADCVALSEIKEHIVEVKSAEGVWQHTVALSKLSAYSGLYLAAKQTEIALAIGPDCASGIVFGEPDSIVAVACDFATALLLVGDLRDFAYHSWWLYWETKDDEGQYKFDKAIYIFSSLGIATTAASATGIGVTIDAAIAGCKIAAKIMKGAELPIAIATHFEKKLDGDYFDLQRVSTVSQSILGLMQVTAAVILYKDEFSDVYKLVKDIDRNAISGWISYLQKAANQVEPTLLGYNHKTDVPDWIRVAYAALDRVGIMRRLDANGAVQGLIRTLDDTFDLLEDANLRGLSGLDDLRPHIRQMVSASIKNLGEAIEIADKNGESLVLVVEEMIAKDSVLSALSVMNDVAVKRGITEIGTDTFAGVHRFPCTKSNCDLGGFSRQFSTSKEAFDGYFKLFSRFPALLEDKKIDAAAYEDLAELFTQMANQNVNISRGATEVIPAILRWFPEEGADSSAILKRIELNRTDDAGVNLRLPVENGTRKQIAKRGPDFVVEVNGVTKYVEVKSWDAEPDLIVDRLGSSLEGTLKVSGEQTGQLRNDLISVMIASVDNAGELNVANIDRIWQFDGRAAAANFDSEFYFEILSEKLLDRDFARKFLETMQHPHFPPNSGLDTFLEFVTEGDFRKVIDEMFPDKIPP